MRLGRAGAVYGAAGALAVAVGAAAALLRPPPPSPTTVELRGPVQPIPAAVARRRLVESLVEGARASGDPRTLPAFPAALSLLADEPARAWLLPRLLEGDVPEALRLALAERAPRRGWGPEVAETLLEPSLQAASPDAVAVVRTRGEASVAQDVVCRCTFGIWRGWAVAWGRGLGWSPSREQGVWTLHLRRVDGGPAALAMPLAGAQTLRATDEGGPTVGER